MTTITIHDINRTKISAIEGVDECEFTFSVDETIDDFEVRANAQSRNDGIVVEKANIRYVNDVDDGFVCNDEMIIDDGIYEKGTVIDARIDHFELNGDGEYLIKVFVRNNEDKLWYE